MRTSLVAVLALSASVVDCMAGARSGGQYAVNDIVDSAGGRLNSSNGLYTVDSSLGGIGGVSAAAAPTPSRTVKHGYAGQLYDIVGLVLDATPATVEENQTRQLTAASVLDDGTFLAVTASNVNWSVVAGPLASVSSSGLVTAAMVYQHTNGTAGGTHLGFTSTFQLSVLNVGNDDFGIYALDQIDDAWQVQYFGENNANGLATADPDGDGQNNKFEFVAGIVPNDPASRFSLRIAAVAGQPGQRQLIFSPRLADRTYAPQFRTSLTSGNWGALTTTAHTDNGAERTIVDLDATGTAKFYRVDITKP